MDTVQVIKGLRLNLSMTQKDGWQETVIEKTSEKAVELELPRRPRRFQPPILGTPYLSRFTIGAGDGFSFQSISPEASSKI